MTHGSSSQQWAIARCGLLALAILLLMALTAEGSVLQVPENYSGIQVALDACQSGDTVLVARGVYTGLFTLPECDVHLYSHHVLTGDTLDIDETVLDGGYAGSILSTAEGRYNIDIHGFTFVNGQGHWDSPLNQHAGGIDAQTYETMRLDHCVIQDCRSESEIGAAVTTNCLPDVLSRSVVVSCCALVDICQENTSGSSSTCGAMLLYADTVVVKNLRAFTTDLSGFAALWANSEFVTSIEGVLVEDMYRPEGTLFRVTSFGNCFLEDVSIRNCRIDIPLNEGEGARGYFCRVEADSQVVLRNLELSNCTYTCFNGVQGDDGHANTILGEHLNADSVIVRNCHDDSGSFLSLAASSGDDPWDSDVVRNLIVEDCSYGQEVYQGDLEHPCNLNYFIHIYGVDLRDALVTGVTGMTHDRPVSGSMEIGNWIGGVIYYGAGRADTSRIVGAHFYNNLILDRDPNTPGVCWVPNRGRSLYISARSPDPIDYVCLLDSCEFIEQRQPNWIPERDDGMLTDQVGSILYFWGKSLVMRNSMFQGIDDGGVMALCEGNALIENCWFDEVDRSVLSVNALRDDNDQGGVALLRNLFIQNSERFDWEIPSDESTQHPFYVAVAQIGEIENCTITGCNQNSMVVVGSTQAGSSDEGVHLRNCLFYDNIYAHWTSVWNDNSDSCHYCLIPVERPGENNLIGNDPLFDPERGIPFLAPDSPCIDAGHPGAAYNDIEDPDAPGFALWPSQGGLRNDIGFTGGPYAAVREFVSIPPRKASILPTSPKLGSAYPNPFNPVTTIPFVIQQPAHLRLSVYNLRGQLVATLADDGFLPGEHRVTFDARSLASGVYLVSLRGEGVNQTRKTLLLK